MKFSFQAGWALGLLAMGAGVAAQEPVTILSSKQAQSRADATVRMTGGAIGVGVGYSWGRGIVSYGGNEQAFCIKGLSVGDVGAAHLHADSFLFTLPSLDAFSGKYFAKSAGAAVAGGQSATVLKNK